MKYGIMPGSGDDAGFLSDKPNEHDNACVPRGHKYIPLDRNITDESGSMIAGFVGGVDGWNGAEISALWVDGQYQRQGIGSRLLSEVEREVKENGAHVMLVDAFDRNVGFFRKNGYQITGTLEDLPKGHRMYLAQKFL